MKVFLERYIFINTVGGFCFVLFTQISFLGRRGWYLVPSQLCFFLTLEVKEGHPIERLVCMDPTKVLP